MAELRYDSGIVDCFLVLLRSGMGKGQPDSFPDLSEEEWNAILSLAKIQTVTGLVYQGAATLPPSVEVPESVSLQLMLESSRIKSRSREILSALKEIFAILREKGFHPQVLKGPSVARMYPHPELRESGDLDIFLPPSEYGEAVFVLGDPSFTLPDGSVHYNWKGVDVDLHRHYFDLHTGEDNLPPVPSPYAVLVLLSSHILKHCMGPGIGLRQMCDMAVAYDFFSGNRAKGNDNRGAASDAPLDKELLLRYYEKAGILKWNTLLSSFIKEYLGGNGYPFTDPDGKEEELPSPSFLMESILKGGNFGHYDAERESAIHGGAFRRKLHTLWLYLKKMPFSLKYAPSEFWSEFRELALGNLRRKDIL